MAFPRKGPLSPSFGVAVGLFFSKFLHKKMNVLGIEESPSGAHYTVLEALYSSWTAGDIKPLNIYLLIR